MPDIGVGTAILLIGMTIVLFHYWKISLTLVILYMIYKLVQRKFK